MYRKYSFKTSLAKRERRETRGWKKIVSRGGLTFYFHLFSGHKIIFWLCRQSEHYKNV